MPQTPNESPKQTRDYTIAITLKTARDKLGYDQIRAAEKWGINLRTLQNWESARSQPRGLARTHLEKILTDILDAPTGAGRKHRSG